MCGHTEYHRIFPYAYPSRDHALFAHRHQLVVVDARVCLIGNGIPDAQLNIVLNLYILCDNCFLKLTVFTDLGLVHNDGVPDHRTRSDGNAASDHGIVNLSTDFAALTDNALLYHAV